MQITTVLFNCAYIVVFLYCKLKTYQFRTVSICLLDFLPTPLFLDKNIGLVRDLNPGPLAPKARIIPLDQRAMFVSERKSTYLCSYIVRNSCQGKRTAVRFFIYLPLLLLNRFCVVCLRRVTAARLLINPNPRINKNTNIQGD